MKFTRCDKCGKEIENRYFIKHHYVTFGNIKNAKIDIEFTYEYMHGYLTEVELCKECFKAALQEQIDKI